MRIDVRATKGEWEMVREMSHANGVSMSDLVRELIRAAYLEHRRRPALRPAAQVRRKDVAP